jgi:hypothetical protein
VNNALLAGEYLKCRESLTKIRKSQDHVHCEKKSGDAESSDEMNIGICDDSKTFRPDFLCRRLVGAGSRCRNW